MSDPLPAAAFVIRSATTADLPWISALQQKLYSVADAVPFPVLEEWFQANANGFSIITDASGHPLGQFTLLPLKPSCLERYRREGEGGLIETEIRGEDLYSPAEREAIRDLYIESIILPVENRREAQSILMQSLPGLLFRLKNKTDSSRFYALAATPAGERWLARMGFQLITAAENRRDQHPFFAANSAEFLQRAGHPAT